MIDYIDFRAKTTNPLKLHELLARKSYDKSKDLTYYSSSKNQFNNLFVTLINDLVIVKGSLHKSFKQRATGYNENITPLTYSELVNEIEYLINLFSLDPNTSKITKVDFGYNLPLRHHPSEYLSRILCYIGKNNHNYSLSERIYNSKSAIRKLRGDKTVSIAYNKSSDPKIDSNLKELYPSILRVEIKAKNNDQEYFPATVGHLIDIDNLQQMAIAIKDFVTNLQFQERPVLEYYLRTNAKDALIHILLTSANQKEVYNYIDSLPQKGYQKKAVREAYIKALNSIPKVAREYNYKEELVNAVDKAIHAFFTNT